MQSLRRSFGGALIALAVLMGAWLAVSGHGEVYREPTIVVTTALRDPAPFAVMVLKADIIVAGVVRNLGEPQSSSANGSGGPPRLWTPVTLAVDEVLKGDVGPGGTLIFAQLGGSKDGLTSIFAGQTQFRMGERVLVCLYRPTGLFTEWTGGNLYADEGKYTIGHDGMATNVGRSEALGTDALVQAIRAVLSPDATRVQPR